MSDEKKKSKSKKRLSVARMDMERMVLMPAGRFTQSGPLLSCLLAIIGSLLLYGGIVPFRQSWLAQTLTERGWVPYVIVFFTLWAIAILLIKLQKIRTQQRAVAVGILPDDPQFTLSVHTVQKVIDRLHEVADEPRHFLLFNRILIALSSLKNMGRIGDLDEILHSQAQNDEAAIESSYTVVRGLTWAIPVLGFIGTVLGLSDAIGSFAGVLAQSSEMDAIKSELQSVASGLATAFETTLQALMGALAVQLLMTMVKRKEEYMLDQFLEYCQVQIVGRLRIE